MSVQLLCFVVILVLIVMINVLIGHHKILHYIVSIVSYILISILIHYLLLYLSKPYISSLSPKHLIIIVPGYLGHHSRLRDYVLFFKSWFKSIKNDTNDANETLINNNDGNIDDIMVYVSNCNSNGLFCYSICKTNDGIEKGGLRVYNETVGLLLKYPTINKISFIGTSLGGIYSRYALSMLYDSDNNELIKNIKPINYISVVSPHIGVDIYAKQSMRSLLHIHILGYKQ